MAGGALYQIHWKKGPDKNHSASMSKQESKIIEDTQEKMEVRKKILLKTFRFLMKEWWNWG